MALFHKYSMF